MSTFDPNRILHMAHCLENGTLEEKLDLIEHIDTSDPIAVGILMRGLNDDHLEVRMKALQILDAAAIRPSEPILAQLLEDPDARIREMASQLGSRPDALNPLEQLIPLIESMAESLGPLGGLLKTMIETLRNIGDQDERTQQMTLSKLTSDNPAAALAVTQALNSPFISVRIAALRKALVLDDITIPEELIRDFIADPSPEIREAAEALIRASKIGPFDEGSFRTLAMKSMINSLLGNLNVGGLDLSALLGKNLDLGALTQGKFDLGALFSPLASLGPTATDQEDNPFVNTPDLDRRPPPEEDALLMQRIAGERFKQSARETQPPPNLAPHRADGHIYLVGDVRILERMLRILGAISELDMHPLYERIHHPGESPRWAIRAVPEAPTTPRWPELLLPKGLALSAAEITAAEQARLLSEQIWGAAYADLHADPPFTLVFHDGILSRAEWSGPVPQAWSPVDSSLEPNPSGPLALLKAFLDDPTDDELKTLPDSDEPLYIEV